MSVIKPYIDFFSSSIKRKILSIFILISLISIFVISFFSIHQIKDAFTKKSIVDYGKIVGEIYYNINRVILIGKTDINMITNNPVIISKNNSPKEKLNELNKLQKTLKIYDDLTIINPDGIVVTSTRYSYRGDWRYKKHFLDCLKGETIVSNVQAIRSPEKYIIDFTAPVFNEKGEIISVIAAQLDMKTMSDIITHMKIGKTGHAFLLNSNKKIIAHRNTEKIFLKPEKAIVEQMRKRDESLYFSNDMGIEHIGVFFDRLKAGIESNDYKDNIDWAVVILQEKNEMFGPLNNIILRIVIHSMIIGWIIVVFAVLFSNTITEPIQKLTEGAVIIGRGDLTHRVEIETSDELKQLSGSFNTMAENLLHSKKETELIFGRLKQREIDLNKAQSIAHMGSWEWNIMDGSFNLSDEMCLICGIDNVNKFSDIWDMINQVIHPDDKKSGYSQIEKSIQLEVADKLNYRIVRPGGEIRWIEATPPDVNRIADDGTPLSLIGAIQDITHRKRSEDALRESEEKHRQLVENLGQEYFFFSYDTSGTFFYVSPSMTAMLGYEEEIFKVYFSTYLTDNPVNKDLYSARRGSLEGIKQPSYLIEIFHRSGDIRFLEVTEAPVFDSQNKVVAVEGIAHDITTRKRAVDELQQLRNYLTNIIDSMPSILVGVDAGGRITQWNHEAFKVTGTSAENAIGQPISRVFPRLEFEMERVRKAMQLKKVHVRTNQAYQKGNKTNYENITIYPLMEDGGARVNGAVIRVDDVTEKVRVEEVLIQSEKMLSVGGLAAGMAHEINNPLAGIMQTANVMSNRLSNIELRANQRDAEAAGTTMAVIKKFMDARGIPRMLKAIAESGGRATDIVDNMLSFARKGDVAASSHSIVKLIEKALELAAIDYDLKKHHDFKMIEIQKEFDEDIPLVLCEGSEIQQVFMNILRNGAQAMQDAKTTKPRFIIRAGFESNAGAVCVEFEDNGPGMDEEIRKRVFEPFFTTKPVGLGTGLGLSVSYFIITENHNGEMTVESQPGNGSKFTLCLPLEKQIE